MPKENRTDPAARSALDMVHKALAANPAMGAQLTHFWKAQDLVLKEAESFADAWFRRRHEGVQAAIEAGAEMILRGMSEPAAGMTALADWQAGAMRRLAEDAQDGLGMMGRCAGHVARDEMKAAEETMETAAQLVKGAGMRATSEPV